MGFFTRTKKITKPPTDVNSSNQQQHQQPQYCPTAAGNGPQHHPSGYTQGSPPPFGVQPGYGRQQQQLQYQPIVVNQYYLSPQAVGQQTNMQLVHRPQQQQQQPYFRPSPPAQSHADKFSHSVANLNHAGIPTDHSGGLWHDLADIDAITEDWHPHATLLLNQTAACVDILATGFDKLMTSIDREKYQGHEGDLFNLGSANPEKPPKSSSSSTKTKRPRDSTKKQSYKGDTAAAIASSPASTSIISKVELYSNSRLPRDLPPLRLYMPTWPLLCLAAQYAERVYAPPSGAERDAHVPSNWRTGTKAMVIKSVPMDHMSCIVFAIRGTATFADWAVNLNAAPAAPRGFLDDEDNLCHAGFLSVARSMIRPVASRLRQLLQEDPSRAGYSLVITGHSAGGAVASLLFCHMLAEATGKAASELNAVAGCFKRVHCVVFGTPPVSRRPLDKPTRPELAKSLFLSFLNEGDPVARADRAYVKSLLELFVSPAPKRRETDKEKEKRRKEKREKPRFEREKGRKGSESVKVPAEGAVREKKSVVRFAETEKTEEQDEQARKERREKRRKGPVWKVPPSSLSSPGRIVVLRSNARGTGVRRTVEDRLGEGVIAQTVTDEQLRGVVWGDPVCHVMRLYAGRIEALAVGAVTGKG